MGWLNRIFFTLAAGGGAYLAIILALTFPTFQRNATYAYNVNPSFFQNLSNHEYWGFHHHQVQPFTLLTPDNTTLFAWHILPTHLYREHAARLRAQHSFGCKPFTEAVNDVNLQLLFNNPDTNVVINFHGNAGHLANGYRPATYQHVLSTSTASHPVHVITFDYRGFGLSTGSPTESGVIEDGRTVLSALTGYESTATPGATMPRSTGALQTSQIILLAQSFGTFAATATYHDWVVELGRPPLKALVLIASFSSLPKLLESYSLKGLTPPLLSPLMGYPGLQKWFFGRVVDKWETARRLTELVQDTQPRLDLTIMHAADDWEIPWREGRRNFDAILDASENKGNVETESNRDVDVGTWVSEDGTKKVQWERVKHGGHNRVMVGEQTKLALLEALDR